MSKRVLLVYPRIIKGWQALSRADIPMSLLCIATPVVNAGYDVKIIDQRVEPKWRSILKEELRKDPICVGISSMTGPQLRYALEISKIVKAYGNSPVVWGGIHASLLPAQTLENENIDIIVQGEGEETFPDLVQALEDKRPLLTVKGIWYKENGHIKSTGMRSFVDLNKQPPLPYHLTDLRKYTRTMFGIEHLNFFTSRGCPHQCTFCFNAAFDKKKWRPMDPDLTVQRIKDFVGSYNVKGLIFIDSNFSSDLHRGQLILEGVLREELNVPISKINIDIYTILKMDEKDFALLQRVGCRRLPVAVESGSEKIRTLLKKPVDIQRLLEVNHILKKFNIFPVYLFMMGFPAETQEDLSESVSLAFRLLNENPKADIFFNIYTPFPGTELLDMTAKHGLRVPERVEDWVFFNYRNLTQGAPWLSEEMRHLIEMLDFCTLFMGKRPFREPYEKTSPLVSLLCNLYAPLATKRVKSFWSQFPIEIKLAKLLGLYAKQE
jgi:anaerobic magnesium-protoporphyrin IX monomethyl ester cyclase